MPRNPHPESIKEYERDTAMYGPLRPAEAVHALRDLAANTLETALTRLNASRRLLGRPPGSELPATAVLAAAKGTSGGHIMLDVLYDLMAIVESDPRTYLTQAADLLASALPADKLDFFLVSSDGQTLVAEGTSTTPMARRQKALGLDRLALANGGRIVGAYLTGQSFRTGHAGTDPEELTGMVTQLGVRSMMAVPIAIGPRRGVLAAASGTPNAFTAEHLEFVEAVGRYVTLTTAHRASQAASQQDVDLRSTPLTRRQVEVAALISDGLTNGEIAERLVLEQGTVANHIREILRRLDLRNRTEIAVWVARQGIRRELNQSVGQ